MTAEGSPSKIYWTDSANQTVVRANPNGSSVETLVSSGLRAPYGVAAHDDIPSIYWTDGPSETIWRAGLDGSAAQSILHRSGGDPRGIALHPTASAIYVVWGGDQTIVPYALDGGAAPPGLASLGGSQSVSIPIDVAIDADGGYIYWSQNGLDQVDIRRARLDGTGSAAIIARTFTSTGGVAVDPAAGYLYYCEPVRRRIRRARLDGSSPTVMVTGDAAGRCESVAVGDDHIYWTDAAAPRIRRAGKDGSSPETIISAGLRTPFFMAWGPAQPALRARAGTPRARILGAAVHRGGAIALSAGTPVVAIAGESVHARSMQVRAGSPAVAISGVSAHRGEVMARAGLPAVRVVGASVHARSMHARAGSPEVEAIGEMKPALDLPAGRWAGLWSPPAMEALVDGLITALAYEPRAVASLDYAHIPDSALPHLAWYLSAVAYDIEGPVEARRRAVSTARQLARLIGTEAALDLLWEVNGTTGSLTYLPRTRQDTPYLRYADVAVEVVAPLGRRVDEAYRGYMRRAVEACLPFTLQLRRLTITAR